MADDTKAKGTEVDETEVDDAENINESDKDKDSDEKKYSDKEMNAISKKNAEKAEKKLLKSLGITDVEKAKEIFKNAAEREKSAETDSADSALKKATERAVRAEVKNVFAEKNITGKKAERMLGLIDLENCRDDDGNVDKEKVETELEALKSDVPELFTTADEKDQKGFKFGSDGETEVDSKGKKPVDNQKKWNRFNR